MSKKRQIRISFLQAKYRPDRGMFPFEHESFRGDYFQWELLKDRPDIESSNKMNPQLPKKILSTTKYKTITNFGIFYYNKLNNNFINEIDMLYIIPEFTRVQDRKIKK